MKTNIKLTVAATFAALALAGCGKNTEPSTPPPATNAVPSAAQSETPAPSTPQTTNNPAGTNP